MDHFFMSLPLTNPLLNIFVVLFIALCSLFLLYSRSTLKKKAPPEAGGAWPVIGHLHLLGGPQPLHHVLANMADKYGPIFTVKMGVHRALVVSNWEVAKDCLTTNDKAFANRPKSLATEVLGYNHTLLPFSNYGNYWRQVRKTTTLELLSNRRLELLRHVREAELRTSVKELYKLWKEESTSSDKVVVDMKTWVSDIILNVILKLIAGKSVGYMTTKEKGESAEWKEELRIFFDLAGRFVVSDALPFLRWLDIGGHEKAMKEVAKKLDVLVQGWLTEHKEKMKMTTTTTGSDESEDDHVKGKEDFMGLLLNILDGQSDNFLANNIGADAINKATCIALILAGSDTATVTLCWALSLIVNNPHVLTRIQLELDQHVGRQRQVNESDINNLVYLNAVIKETLRLYPPGPLAVPHESIEDALVGDYHIPAGTKLYINLWKIHRDPRVWSDPLEFQPERFLATYKDFDVRGQNFEFIPFGSGRRMCPGVSFALQALHLTLASLLHGFDFATPTGEPLDMIESFGLTNIRATPLEVLIKPRLPSHLY